MITAAYRWIDRNILELGREMRLSYLPPLMVYIGAVSYTHLTLPTKRIV